MSVMPRHNLEHDTHDHDHARDHGGGGRGHSHGLVDPSIVPGDALTAVPLGVAFWLGSRRGERLAGLAVVAVIFFSACVALFETVERLLHPQTLTHLWALAAAGVVGFAANEIAARVRLRAGRRLDSPALIADGNHARTDGFVSLGVIASACLVALGIPRADPLIGLGITLVILKIT
jgi:cation diffusion facilitator family transporter